MLDLDKIYCMDCLEGMRQLENESVDAVVTDPPFGIGFQYDEKEEHDNPEDYWEWLKPIYHKMQRVLKNGGFLAIWQPQKHFKHFWGWFGEDIHIYAACKNFVQIRKTPINYGYDPIVMRYKNGDKPLIPESQKRSIDWFVANTATFVTETQSLIRKHPCPRPIDQCLEIIDNFVIEGGIVLDPFSGSGTIPLAAKQTNRHFLGFEISQEYVDIANRRLRQSNISGW